MAHRLTVFVLLLLLAGCHDQASGGAQARGTIAAVGSSTVYPFTTVVAERYVAADPAAEPPVIEATGTGAGLKLFCAGVGAAYPDLVDASRRMRASEYRDCARHGAGALVELQVGLDGIAIGRSPTGPPLALTSATLYRALAAAPGGRPNPARRWSDVDPALPATPIKVYGPPATSGTRDAFAALILARGCAVTEHRVGPGCLHLREDGAYVDAGENDNLIVRKLAADPTALGIFGWSYLEANAGTIVGVSLDGVVPTRAAITAGAYRGARPLFLYVKKAHLSAVPGLRAFLHLYADSWGVDGPLARRGLIAAPAAIQARSAATLAHETPLDPRELS